MTKDLRYLKHFSTTKADRDATYTELGVKVPYVGVDSAQVVKFAQWEEPVSEDKTVLETEPLQPISR